MRRIKYLVMDVDGTLTDGKIYMGNDGEVFKAFDIKDGYGIHEILPRAGVTPIVITGRESDIVKKRCKELGIQELYQGIQDKSTVLKRILACKGELMEAVALIGDDRNDLLCMEVIKKGGGMVGCPADAAEEVKAISDYVCGKNGGCGAVREFIDWLLCNFAGDLLL